MQQNYDQRYMQIAIDSSNLFWRSVTSCAKKIKAQSIEENVFLYNTIILDFLDRVKDIINQFGYSNTKVYFLFDNPKSKITTRSLIDEHYKSHRCNENIPKEFWDTLAILELILQSYSDNFIIMRLTHCEADDLVLPLVKEKVNDKNKMLLISVDMDWSRALSISENVHWFNYHTLFWHKDIFKDQYGFYPEKNKVKFFKTFKGDPSDDIKPAVSNMPSNVLTHIMNTYDDIDVFINNYNRDEKIPEQWRIKILENRSRILSNYALVDFIAIQEPLKDFTFECKENVGSLRYWYNLLDLPLESRMEIKEEKGSFIRPMKFQRMKRF